MDCEAIYTLYGSIAPMGNAVERMCRYSNESEFLKKTTLLSDVAFYHTFIKKR
jgi:hypothetical protein